MQSKITEVANLVVIQALKGKAQEPGGGAKEKESASQGANCVSAHLSGLKGAWRLAVEGRGPAL